jgi:hypothetical protein
MIYNGKTINKLYKIESIPTYMNKDMIFNYQIKGKNNEWQSIFQAYRNMNVPYAEILLPLNPKMSLNTHLKYLSRFYESVKKSYREIDLGPLTINISKNNTITLPLFEDFFYMQNIEPNILDKIKARNPKYEKDKIQIYTNLLIAQQLTKYIVSNYNIKNERKTVREKLENLLEFY